MIITSHHTYKTLTVRERRKGKRRTPCLYQTCHTRNPHSEHNSAEQSSKSMSDRLERHLGTIIEEMFQPRTTLEWPPQVNLAYDQRVPTAQPTWADTTAEHRQNLLNGVADTRTKLLDSYFFLIVIQSLLFLTYI